MMEIVQDLVPDASRFFSELLLPVNRLSRRTLSTWKHGRISVNGDDAQLLR